MRTYLEISLDNIEHNFRLIRERAGSAAVMAVVKADAYGHGAAEVARVLEDCGADRFAVATADEAAELRAAGITRPVMVLGVSDSARAPELAELQVIQTVGSLEYAETLDSALSGGGKKLLIHFAADTGMSRLGFETGAASAVRSADEIARAARLPHLEAEGIFTHFATSEIPGEPFQREQLERFTHLLGLLRERGVALRTVHISNSGAIFNIPGARFDMVRPGIVLYGVSPDGEVLPCEGLRPAMSLRTRIVQIHEYTEPVSVSYGRRFRSEGPIRTGTVAIGYADGLHRALSGKIDMLVCGKRARQIGNICMDMSMIDLTDIPEARVGDAVTVFGSDGDASIPIEEVAAAAGTIPYEIMCAPSPRVAKVWHYRGKIWESK